MRTIRLLLFTGLAVLSVAGPSAAQDKSAAVLNALELRQLIARSEPGDHAKLIAHFTALADRYAAEARRHTSMSTGFVGNPSRSLGAGMSVHCKRLADLNTRSAATARELAAHHVKLGGNIPTAQPPDGARFEGGAGAPDPTADELNALAARARTPSDHQLVEEYFSRLAQRYTAEAADHTTMAAAYRSLPRSPGNAAAVHCDRLAVLARDSANEAAKAAAEHKSLAGADR